MRIRTTTACLLLATGAAGLAMIPTPAAASINFSATASAFGMRLIVTVPQAPLTPTLVDAGGPSAQALLDSVGNERSLAALPYPGDMALSGPGLLAGLIATTPLSTLPPPPALPGYPFYAHADAQNPKGSTNLPFADMESTAGPDAAAASVRAPGSPEDAPSGMRALSTITRGSTGAVSTSSATSATGLHVGPLTVGSVTSTATMALDPDGKVTRKSTFAARALDIGGTAVDLTPDGFTVGGTPLPVTTAKTLSDALKGAGIDIALLPASQTSTSVVAAALQITRHQDFGPGGTGGSVTLILGQSSVSLTGTPHAVLPALGIVPTSVVPPVPVAPRVSLPAHDTSGSAVVASVPSTASLTPPVATAPAPPATRTPGTEPQRTVAERFDTAPAYLAIVAAILLTVLAGPALRLAMKAFSPR